MGIVKEGKGNTGAVLEREYLAFSRKCVEPGISGQRSSSREGEKMMGARDFYWRP